MRVRHFEFQCVPLPSTELCADKNHRHAVPIDILPDNVLLEIFNFCIHDPVEFDSPHARDWQRLVHICQRWRGLIFASPRQLNLHLNCSDGTPVRQNLVFWPATLPLIVVYIRFGNDTSPEDQDNIVAALEHPSHVCHIRIFAAAPLIKKVATTLQKSFPALTYLNLACSDFTYPVISKRFLG